MPELDIYRSRSICGHFDVTDTDVVEACGLPESRLAARIRRLKQIGCRPLGNAKRFRCERGHEKFIKPEHQCDPANNLIAIGYPVECTDSTCRIFELWKVVSGPFEL